LLDFRSLGIICRVANSNWGGKFLKKGTFIRLRRR
jgi:hypothetical protein